MLAFAGTATRCIVDKGRWKSTHLAQVHPKALSADPVDGNLAGLDKDQR